MSKVLIIAPVNYDFYKDILVCLKKEKHNVLFLKDKLFNFDPKNFPRNRVLSFIKKIVFFSLNTKKRYWKSVIKKYNLLNQEFDILLCFNSTSIDASLLNTLKQNNPQLRCIYYLWDSCKCYEYNKYFQYFDKILTFDMYDSTQFELHYLPMYWKEIEINCMPIIEPKVFFIGTIHSDRYQILNKIKTFLEENKVSYNIQLYIYKTGGLLFFLKYLYFKFLKNDNLIIQQYELLKGLRDCEFAVFSHTPLIEFNRQLRESTHVVDIEQPIQSGISPRVIQALSLRKKIISTNMNLKYCNFYNSNNIFFIDRINPKIDIDFVNSTDFVDIDIEYLRIDNWLKTILSNDIKLQI